jgi:hypothetical protein
MRQLQAQVKYDRKLKVMDTSVHWRLRMSIVLIQINTNAYILKSIKQRLGNLRMIKATKCACREVINWFNFYK